MNKDVDEEIQQKQRVITAGVEKLEYPNNQIKTSRYTFLTFIPLNLIS